MSLDHLPDVALSIKQPWAWLIAEEFKDVENRDNLKGFRGRFAIHAGASVDASCHRALLEGFHPCTYRNFDVRSVLPEKFKRSGIIAVAEIYDCVTQSENEWFCGKYGLMIRNVERVPFIPCSGALSFFKWKNRVIS